MILSEYALKGNDDKLEGQRDSFIVSVPQPLSSSFACHVSCKVKYYWKVASVKVRFRGGDNVLSFSQLCCSMSPTNQLLAMDHCGSRTQSMKSCHEETNSFEAP